MLDGALGELEGLRREYIYIYIYFFFKYPYFVGLLPICDVL